MARKKDEIQKAGQSYGERISSSASREAGALDNLQEQHRTDMKAVADEMKAADELAIQKTEEAQQQAEQNGAARILEMGNQLRSQQEEGEAQVEADQTAARWTGAGELAAAVANLIAVGEGNAVSQQQRTYSQDWMRKAESDLQEHRSRMADARDRLRVLGERQDALKAGNAKALEKMRLDASERQAAFAKQRADAELAAGVKSASIRAEGEQKAAQADYQEKRDKEALQRRQAEFSATMAARGYNPDGTLNKTLFEAINATKTGGKGQSSLVSYPIMDKDGNVNVAKMKSEEMKGLLAFAQGAISDELGEADGKQFEREMRKAADDKEKNAVLTKWMAKSKSCETAIRLIDESYQGVHGTGATIEKPAETIQQAPAQPPSQDQAAVQQNRAVGGASDLDKMLNL